MRRSGGAFSQAQTIAVQRPRGGALRELARPTLAFRGRGELVVAYVRHRPVSRRNVRVVEARTRRSAGDWSRAQRLGPAPENFTDLRVVAVPGGPTVAAWGNGHQTVMGVQSRWIVRAAIQRRGSTRFAPAQTLDPGAVPGAGIPSPIGLGIAADGTATVAWSARVPVRPAVWEELEIRAANTRRDGRFARAQVLATGGARLSDLEVAPDGTALATWSDHQAPPRVGIAAALRPAGSQAFMAPERVAWVEPRGPSAPAPAPAAGLSPRNGRPFIVWAADHGARTPPEQGPPSAVLQLAARAD